MQKWISIKDQLPEGDVGILVTDGKVVVTACLCYLKNEPRWWSAHGFGGYEWEFDFSSTFKDNAITHWMPLPDLPSK